MAINLAPALSTPFFTDLSARDISDQQQNGLGRAHAESIERLLWGAEFWPPPKEK